MILLIEIWHTSDAVSDLLISPKTHYFLAVVL